MKTLERRLGLASVVAISIAAMLGSGLFVLPGLAAHYSGPSLWLAYLVSGLCVVPAALSKSELATAMPESGGTYVFIDRTFGPLAGTVAGLGLWLSLLLKSAFALMGFGAYLSVLADVSQRGVAMVLLVLVTLLNLVGIRKVGRVQMIVVVVAVVSLTLLASDAMWVARPVPLSESFPNGLLGFWSAVSFVYISFAGVTKVAAVAEEVENPARNLPIGILASLILVTALYTAVSYALVGNVPMSSLVGNLRPIYTLAEILAGPRLGTVVAILGVVTMTSMALSGLLAASRFPFAMARNGLLPKVLSYISGRFTTPGPSILFTAALMGSAILFLDVASIAKLASSLMILAFMALNVAVIVLRESSVQWYKPAFRSPLYPFVQVVGLLVGASLLLMLGWLGIVASLVSFVPGLVVFFLFGRANAERMGVLGRMGPRQALLASETPQERAVLPDRAAVVVPILGESHSVESLAELGAALGAGSKVEVVHIEDLPEQIALDAAVENPWATSLRRRVQGMAKEHGYDMDFESVATHDHVRVVHDISQRVNSEWLLMEWRGRTDRGVLPFNPLGWLADNLACNLAVYKDAGGRRTEKILVYPEPGPHDALVVITAEHLARVFDASITIVRYVPREATGELVRAEQDYLEELSGLCGEEAFVKLVRGTDELTAIAGLTSEYDLLITGAAPSRSFWSFVHIDRAERLMRRCACSALRLTAPRRLSYRAYGKGLPQNHRIRLHDFLVGECVEARVDVRSKAALFTHVARSFSTCFPTLRAADIEEALWDRERSQNTSLGDGLAVPHATVGAAERTYLGVFTTTAPVDYRSPDGGQVDVVFVTVGPPSDRNTHLGILSSMAWLVAQTPFLGRVRAADDANELIAVLLASAGLNRRPSSNPPAGEAGDGRVGSEGDGRLGIGEGADGDATGEHSEAGGQVADSEGLPS